LSQLTFNQLLLLKSTLETYNTNENLQQLQSAVFDDSENIEFILRRNPDPTAAAAAYPLGGSPPQGVIMLFTKNLFHSKYNTAASIAHEAAHIWQGKSVSCLEPDVRLRREIGDGTIPPGFDNWTAEELIQAVRQRKIGAYHVSYWVAFQLGDYDLANWDRKVITNGHSMKRQITNCSN
jgi:hypothetical protein